MSEHRPGEGPGTTQHSSGFRFATAPEFPDLPEATIARLPEYLRALHMLADARQETVSSEGLAAAAGVNSAKLRKDLSHLGSYGTRGVGYDVGLLIEQIEYVLGITQKRAVALVGIGNLGHALADYAGFASRGFRIAALFDADPKRVGEQINSLVVRHIDELAEVVRQESISIAVIATPATAAQQVADRLVAAGVTSILNFAPCVLSVPEGVDVRKVDLAIELQILSFHEHRKSALTALPGGRSGPNARGSRTSGTQAPGTRAPGRQASDPQESDPQMSGTQAPGRQASDPQASDPQASDPQASDPQAFGPEVVAT